MYSANWCRRVSYIHITLTAEVHLNALVYPRAYLLSMIVEKSKKCVDFTFTLVFLHVIITSYYYEVRYMSIISQEEL